MQWSSANSKYMDGMLFVPVNFPFNKPDGILIENLALPQLIEYIQNKKIVKAFIQGISDFDFLVNCHTLAYIAIELKLPFDEYSKMPMRGRKIYKKYNLDYLYDFPRLKSLKIINNEDPIIKAELYLDMTKLTELQQYSGNYAFVHNLDQAFSLKSLILDQYLKSDFVDLRKLKLLDTIKLTFSKLHSLQGCEAFSKLQCLYLYRNRALTDITALRGVKNTLKALRIENCPKIQDFSVLGELENLELLELSGSNTLPNLNFLKSMKNLKTFVFNMNVLDGDLSPCLNLSYVYSEKNRKHYNLKDAELPKGEYIRGNENIEEWRRLE